MHPIEALLSPLGRILRNRRADESASIANAPELVSENHIELTSPSFRDGETIPAKHCGKFIGPEISPALNWSELPPNTKDLVLVFEDLDSPGRTPRIHTVAAFAPTVDGLGEGALTPDNPAVRFLPAPAKGSSYLGPRPMPGHGAHRYRFHLYALDTVVDLTPVGSADHLPAALAGHVLTSGTLTGTRTS